MDTEEIIIMLSHRVTKLENEIKLLKKNNNKYLVLLLLFIIIFNYYENTKIYTNKLHMFYDIIYNTFIFIRYSTLTSLLAIILIMIII